MTIKATQSEVAKLAGNLDFLREWAQTDKKLKGSRISPVVEETIDECVEIADRILSFGVEGK